MQIEKRDICIDQTPILPSCAQEAISIRKTLQLLLHGSLTDVSYR